jgi:MFS family permease
MTGRPRKIIYDILQYTTLLIAPFLTAFVVVSVAPILPNLANYFAASGQSNSEFLAKMALAGPSLMIAFGAPLAGFAAEAVGRKRAFIAFLSLFALAGVAGALPLPVIPFVGLRLLVGLGGGGIAALGTALVADLYTGRARDRLIGYGSAVAAVLSMLTLMIEGVWVRDFGWQSVFGLFLVAVPVLVAGLVGISPDETPLASTDRGATQSVARAWPIYLLIVVFATAIFMMFMVGPFLFVRAGIQDAETRSTLLAILALGSGAAAASYGWLRAWFSNNALLVFSGLLLGISYIAAGYAHSATVFGFVVLATGIGGGLPAPALLMAVVGAVPPLARGRAVGIGFCLFYVGQFLTPIVFAPFQAALDLAGGIVVFGIVVAVVAVALAFTPMGLDAKSVSPGLVPVEK